MIPFVLSYYRAYGLNCVSDAPVPGFSAVPANLAADLTLYIKSRDLDWVRHAKSLPSSLYYTDGTGPGETRSGCTLTSFGSGQFFELAYADGACFIMDRAAERLAVSRQARISIDELATYLRGPVMGFALRRRDITALHASAVCLGGHAIAFCGGTEAGKSTIAAAFALQNVRVLSDDITALHEETSHFFVEPGYPWICLWPDVLPAFFAHPDTLPRITPSWDKRYFALQDVHFAAERKPLAAIYMVAPRVNESSSPRTEDIPVSDAALELIKNTYMNWLLDKRQRAAEFDIIARIVSQVPIRRLVPHSDPARMRLVPDLVASDFPSFAQSRVKPLC